MGWNSESEVVLLTLDEADMCRKWAPGMDDSIPVFYLRCVFQEACERLNRLKPKQIVPRCHSDSESLEAAPCCFYQTGKCRFRDGKCDYEHVKSNVCHFSVYRGYCTSGHAGLDQNRVGDFEFPVLTVREVFFAFKGKDIRPFPSWTSGGVLSFFRDDSFHLPLFGMNFSVYGFFKPDPASKRRKFKDDEDDNDDLAFFGVRDIRKADQKIKAAKLEMAVRSYKLSKSRVCSILDQFDKRPHSAFILLAPPIHRRVLDYVTNPADMFSLGATCVALHWLQHQAFKIEHQIMMDDPAVRALLLRVRAEVMETLEDQKTFVNRIGEPPSMEQAELRLQIYKQNAVRLKHKITMDTKHSLMIEAMGERNGEYEDPISRIMPRFQADMYLDGNGEIEDEGCSTKALIDPATFVPKNQIVVGRRETLSSGSDLNEMIKVALDNNLLLLWYWTVN